MELKNRKVAVMGDSITEGHGASGPDALYHAILAKKYGWDLYVDGISGTRIAPQRRPSANPRFDLDFLSRIKDMPTDAEIVVFFGGTNDFGHGDAPFGKWGDINPDTFCGACFRFMKSMIEHNPHAVYVIMTPLHRRSEDSLSGDCKPLAVARLEDYVNIIRRTAEYMGMPVLDLYRMSGLQPRIPIIQELYVPDGLHPNDAGQKIIADRLEGFLLSL